MTSVNINDRINKLPRWVQAHIEILEERVRHAEATIPWTEPGMEWLTLLKDSEPTTLFLCSDAGTQPLCHVGKGDRVFVGRARKDQDGE